MSEKLFNLWKENIGYSVEELDRKAVIKGIACTSEYHLASQEEAREFIFRVVAFIESKRKTKPMLANNAFAFIIEWLKRGRRYGEDSALLKDLELAIQAFPDSPRRTQCLQVVGDEIAFFPRVVGRWASDDFRPLKFLDWRSRKIAVALTAMSAPLFFDLRPYEFKKVNGEPGPNLKTLTLHNRMMSDFVSVSVMSAAVESAKKATKVVCKWINVCMALLELHNFDICFAVYSGLVKHPVQRIKSLIDKIPKSFQKSHDMLDEMFSPETRMKGLLDAQKAAVQKKVHGMVPAIYWLVQKAELLTETPRLSDNGDMNATFFTSAAHIFGDLYEMQGCEYDPGVLTEDEQLFYFLELERRPLKSEDELYELSDIAKAKLSVRHRSSSSQDIFRRLSSAGERKSERKSVSGNSLLDSSGEVSPSMSLSLKVKPKSVEVGAIGSHTSSSYSSPSTSARARAPSTEMSEPLTFPSFSSCEGEQSSEL